MREPRAKGIVLAGYAVAAATVLPLFRRAEQLSAWPAGFAPDQFDGALCFGVTQALMESEPAIRELARLVKPGGQFWIDALNGWCIVHAIGDVRRKLQGRPRHLRYESPRRIKRLLRQCGFTDIQLHWLPIMPRRSQTLQRIIEWRFVVWAFHWIPPLGLLTSHGFIAHGTKPLRDV